MADYTENFGTNQDPLAGDWTTIGAYGCRADSGVCDASNSADTNISALIGLSFTNDQSAKITLSTVANFDNGGVGVRCSAGTNGSGYFLYSDLSNARVIWVERTNGTDTGLGVYSVTLANGSTIKLDVAGTTLSRYHNDILLDTTTNSTHSTGVPGVYYSWTSSRATKMDTFIATGYNAASGTYPYYYNQLQQVVI